jgi:dipeptidyl aminopeptidase/acylaminoacyl peptidase
MTHSEALHTPGRRSGSRESACRARTAASGPGVRSTPAIRDTGRLTGRRDRPAALAILLVAVAITALATPILAQPRPMTLVDLINVARLSDPQLSPDGRQVLFVKSEADWKANKRITHIWRTSLDGSDVVQLTTGAEGESNPRWSPDGRFVAFIAKRDGDEEAQIYLLPAGGGEAQRLTKHETAVSSITWSPDGRHLYFLAADPKPADQQAREKAKDDIYAFDENYQQRHLWKVTVATKAEERITSGDFTVAAYELSRDGTRIAFHRAPNPLFGYADQAEVWVMDASGANAVQLTKNSVGESGASLSPDNRQVLFLADANERFEPYYNGRIFIVDAGGGPARMLGHTLPGEVQRAEWSKDGKAIYVTAGLGVESQILRVDPAGGTPVALTRGEHSIASWHYHPGLDRFVCVIDEPSNPGEIWTLSGSGQPAKVTSVFASLAQQYRLPRQERVTWKGADGVAVEGLLFYPLDYQAGRRYPLVVQTHGGPASADRFGFGSWSSYVQVLAAKGYAVLKPNYRGSTGYGDDFLRDMVGHYFKNAHLDVMAGVDHLIAQGIADPDRLVKMGWSAGGHMTNKIITFTDRFKAASSGAGAANWISMYAQSDVRSYRTPWFGGTPWQKNAPIDVYWEHSPLKYVANVRTPTIFIVGERDVRVPMPQSVEMYRALKSNGVPTHLYVAPREPHGFQELRHQLFKMNVELAWFEKHVMGRDYTWEKAPGDEKAEATTTASAARP